MDLLNNLGLICNDNGLNDDNTGLKSKMFSTNITEKTIVNENRHETVY